MGMLHLDAEGTVTFENHPFRQIIGESVEDAWIGLKLYEVPGLDSRLQVLIARMLEEGVTFHNEEVIYQGPRDRPLQRLVIHGSPIRPLEGGIVGAVLTVEDVTEQRRRAEELRLHDRYAQAESALRAAALDAKDEATFLDKAAYILGGTTSADQFHLLVHTVGAVDCATRVSWARNTAHPELLRIRYADFPILHDLGRQHDSLHLDVHNDTSEGHALLEMHGAIEALWAPFYEHEKLGGFIVFERTMTSDRASDSRPLWYGVERYLLDKLVQVFETLWAWIQVGNQYRYTVSTIDGGLFNFTFNEDGTRRYLFVTHQIESLVGYSPGVVLGHTDSTLRWIVDLIHPADQVQVQAHDRVLQGGEESRITYRVQHRDGSTRWLREHALAHVDPSGYLTVSGILTDVTEQKTAEAVLLEAKQEAESSNQLKTAFIATMSHEIRTPLGAVNGYAELLARELEELEEQSGQELPAPIHEFVDAIHDRAQKLLVLVNDLFDLSHVELGSAALQRVPVPLHEVVQQLAEKATRTLSGKSVDLHLQLASSHPVALGDPRRIEQVLDNLISNAIKFTEKGSITIRTQRQQHEVLLEVTDTGVGIDEAYLEKLFIPFSQEEDWRNRRFEGAGLGLTFVQRVLALLDGRIEVNSEKGRGSTFRVFLPAVQEPVFRTLKRHNVKT